MSISDFLLKLNRKFVFTMDFLNTVLKSDESTFLSLTGFNTSDDYFAHLYDLHFVLKKPLSLVVDSLVSDLFSYYRYCVSFK